MAKKLLKILSIALIYCGAVFGAGFASGREIFSFFSCYKMGGILSSVFVGFLFSFFGFFVCRQVKSKNIKTQEEYFAELFPTVVARGVAFITNVFLILSFCIMITGCGALILEQLGFPNIYGSLFSAILCFFVIKNDISGLEKFNLFATPIMLLGVVVLCVLCLRLDVVSVVEVDEIVSPAVSGVLYVSYNMVSAVAVMVAASKIAKTPHDAALGGATGGILIGIPLVLMSAILAYHWEVASKPLPFFALIYDNFPKISIVCGMVLYFAMLTTAVSSGVAVLSGVKAKNGGKYTFLLCLLAFLMSFFPFAVLVQTIYTAFGFIGVVLLVGIVIKILRK